MFPKVNWSPDILNIRDRLNQIWLSLGTSMSGSLLVGTECPYCLEHTPIGVRHQYCVPSGSPENVCPICLNDERYGTHSSCKVELPRRREEIILIIKNSIR